MAQQEATYLMAEQQVKDGSSKASIPSLSDISSQLPHKSGAEQDIHASHFSGKPNDESSELPKSGAEQDVYASHFSGKLPSASELMNKLPTVSGAEQDVHGSHFGDKKASDDTAN